MGIVDKNYLVIPDPSHFPDVGGLGGSVSIDSPCPDKDSPVKGLNIEDVPVRSLESSSC